MIILADSETDIKTLPPLSPGRSCESHPLQIRKKAESKRLPSHREVWMSSSFRKCESRVVDMCYFRMFTDILTHTNWTASVNIKVSSKFTVVSSLLLFFIPHFFSFLFLCSTRWSLMITLLKTSRCVFFFLCDPSPASYEPQFNMVNGAYMCTVQNCGDRRPLKTADYDLLGDYSWGGRWSPRKFDNE